MKLLVLGGTGAMGAHLVSILSHSEHILYVTSRNNHRNYGNVTYIQGDAHSTEFLENLLQSTYYDAIVDFMFYSAEEFKARAPMLLNNTGQYFCISSARVYADSKNHITEHCPRLTETLDDKNYFEANEYSQSKCKIEDVLIKSEHHNWTIIRPYITYGETRMQLGCYELKDWFYRVQHGRSIQLAKKIAEADTTITYGYDVARGIAALIGNSNTLGEIFHITCNKSIKWGEVLNIYAKEIKNKMSVTPLICISKNDIFSSAGISDMQVKYDRCYNRRFDNSKINRYIDTSTFTDPEIGLRKCLSKFLSNPVYIRPDWWKQALIDRVTTDEEYAVYCKLRFDRFLPWKQRLSSILHSTKLLLSKL